MSDREPLISKVARTRRLLNECNTLLADAEDALGRDGKYDHVVDDHLSRISDKVKEIGGHL